MNLTTGLASDNTPADLARIFTLAGILRAAGYEIKLTSSLDSTELWTNAPADVAAHHMDRVNAN